VSGARIDRHPPLTSAPARPDGADQIDPVAVADRQPPAGPDDAARPDGADQRRCRSCKAGRIIAPHHADILPLAVALGSTLARRHLGGHGVDRDGRRRLGNRLISNHNYQSRRGQACTT